MAGDILGYNRGVDQRLEFEMTGFADDTHAEAAFYQAFANCDLQGMQAVWDRGNVACVHPGGSVLLAYEQVMRSWKNILTNAQPSHLDYKVMQRTIDGNLAIHIVEEHISASDDPHGGVVVLATNVYIKKGQMGWLMQAHHASLTRQTIAKPTLQ